MSLLGRGGSACPCLGAPKPHHQHMGLVLWENGWRFLHLAWGKPWEKLTLMD